MDPIAGVIKAWLEMTGAMPVQVRGMAFMFQVSVTCALLSLTCRDLLWVRQRREEHAWSDLCGALLVRIERLQPQYAAVVVLEMRRSMAPLRRRKLIEWSRALGVDTKRRAERSYCVNDAMDKQTTALLVERLYNLSKED